MKTLVSPSIKKTLLAAFSVGLLTCPAATGQSYTSDYIEKFKEIAISEMKSTGIPASITLAQACLESSYGRSTLAVEANNHFGIKCHGWKGETMYRETGEGDNCFRKYESAEHSFSYHSDFLRYRDRYAFLFDYAPDDYKSWAAGLSKAGYSTNPKYAELLTNLIERYDLAKYDTEALGQVEESGEAIPPSPIVLETPEKVDASAQVLRRYSGQTPVDLYREIFRTNGVEFVKSYGGENFAVIAKEFNLSMKEILKYNDAAYDRELEPDAVVYLMPKKKNAAKHIDRHVVEEGETLHSLSQRYAVKIKYLCRYNALKPQSDLTAGTIINLKKSK